MKTKKIAIALSLLLTAYSINTQSSNTQPNQTQSKIDDKTYGQKSLILACKKGNLELLKSLINQGIDAHFVQKKKT